MRIFASLSDELFYPSGNLRPARRLVSTPAGPRMEFAVRCMGCHDTGVAGWRRPSPRGNGFVSYGGFV